MTETEKYLASLNGHKEEIVTVTAPSGHKFQFAKPSKFTMLFRYGRMPQTATNGAVKAWIAAGVLKPGEIADDQAKQIDEALQLRDRVLELSRKPKLVVGEALNPGELSTDNLSDEDATFLFAWVGAGGDTSLMLNTFPQGSQPGLASRTNGKRLRRKAK